MTNCIYICENKRCSGYNKPFTAMHFKEYRMATGKPVKCSICGNVATWMSDLDTPAAPLKIPSQPVTPSWDGRGYRREG